MKKKTNYVLLVENFVLKQNKAWIHLFVRIKKSLVYYSLTFVGDCFCIDTTPEIIIITFIRTQNRTSIFLESDRLWTKQQFIHIIHLFIWKWNQN